MRALIHTPQKFYNLSVKNANDVLNPNPEFKANSLYDFVPSKPSAFFNMFKTIDLTGYSSCSVFGHQP
jgi:hypothetical protein